MNLRNSLAILLPYLQVGLRNRLGALSPYKEDGGIPGELYALMDLDEVSADGDFPQMAGPAALRLALKATGGIILTTAMEDMGGMEASQNAAIALFLDLHARAIEEIPFIGRDIPPTSPCIIRSVRLVDDRLSRVVYQNRKGGAGSLWTMHLTGEIEVSYIARRDVETQLFTQT